MERGEAGALGVPSRRLEEGVQVRVDDAVQHAAFSFARLIGGARKRHGRGIPLPQNADSADKEIRQTVGVDANSGCYSRGIERGRD